MLEGRRIVVTGSSRGIGRAIAQACAREGAVVAVNCRESVDEARAVVAEDPDHFRLLPFDVRDREEIESAVARFCDEEGSIDAWVNNAGINRPGLLAAADWQSIREQIEVNLLGPVFCARAVLPVMLRQQAGVILNVGSVAAPRPVRGQAVYAAAKGGLEALTRALAGEYARKGIRVLCIRPGPTETAMLESTWVLGKEEVLARSPTRRLGQPTEVADLAVFLLSDRAQFVTGSIHSVDGGYLLG